MEYTAYRSPWQFGYVERVIESIKIERLDHLIILNENHLRSILTIIFIIIISAELSWD
jgi:hypothetical protein